MKRAATLALTSVLLTGCAVPVPLQVASWIADGVSLLTTEKSLTDHGISMVVDKDCALFRGITEGEVCRDDADGGPVAVADAGTAPSVNAAALAPERRPATTPDLRPEFPAMQPGLDQLAKFETAAGTPADTQPALAPATDKTSLDQLMAAAEAAPAPKVAAAPAPVQQTAKVAAAGQPLPGLYLVIGSFRDHANARTMLARHPGLSAQVLAAKVSKNTVFRVVVGPFVQPQATTLKSMVRKAGIRDTWSIKVKPEDWRVAERLEAAANVRYAAHSEPAVTELAELPR